MTILETAEKTLCRKSFFKFNRRSRRGCVKLYNWTKLPEIENKAKIGTIPLRPSSHVDKVDRLWVEIELGMEAKGIRSKRIEMGSDVRVWSGTG